MDPSTKTTKMFEPKEMQKGVAVPISRDDESIFNDEFVKLKLRFAEEMKRVGEEMTNFSRNLMHITEKTETPKGVTTKEHDHASSDWEMVAKSPLVEKDGEMTVLRLQFDVSQFHPDEVTARVCNNMLYISAVHQELCEDSVVYNELKREFTLPANTNADAIQSSITKDGILIIKVPVSHLHHENAISIQD